MLGENGQGQKTKLRGKRALVTQALWATAVWGRGGGGLWLKRR